MQRRVTLLCAVLVLLLGCKPVPPLPTTPPVSQPSTAMQSLLDLHNKYRHQSNELPPLAWHTQVAQAAQAHAKWMATKGVMSHTGEGGSSFWQRLKQTGISGASAGGENIAAGYRTVDAVFVAWQKSKGHNENILNGLWTHTGLAMVPSSAGTNYWCVVFAKVSPGGQMILSEPEFLRLPDGLPETQGL